MMICIHIYVAFIILVLLISKFKIEGRMNEMSGRSLSQAYICIILHRTLPLQSIIIDIYIIVEICLKSFLYTYVLRPIMGKQLLGPRFSDLLPDRNPLVSFLNKIRSGFNFISRKHQNTQCMYNTYIRK